jgi:hypothetical protein
MLRRLLLASVLVSAVLLPKPAGANSSAVCGDRNPFPAGLNSELASRYPGRRFSGAVFDDATGCTYLLNSGLRMTTASVLKIEVMAGILLRAQREGRGLTQWERDRIWPMITESANSPTTELWNSLGGVSGMERLDGEFGMTDTVHVGPKWGATSTSVMDQTRLLRQVLVTGGPLTDAYRAEARFYMTHVVPSQRWGSSAGVPNGWTVAQKNGFADSACCNWRLNTAGWVFRPNGTGWSIVLLTDSWPTEAQGIAAVDALGGRVNRVIADPPWVGPGTVFTGTGDSTQEVWMRSPAAGSMLRGTGDPLSFIDAGGLITSSPDPAAPGDGSRSHVVARGLDGAVWHWAPTGPGPTGWTIGSLGGLCSSGPTAAFSGPARLDVSCRGLDEQLWQRTWTAAEGWAPWAPLGGRIIATPDDAGLQLVAVGGDNAVWQYRWDGAVWRVDSLGGICTTGPAIARNTAGTRVDVFCRGTDGGLWLRTWTTVGGWEPWSTLGGLLHGDIDADSRPSSGTPDIVGIGTDFRVWRYRFQGSWQVSPIT